jgi:hypothetical protein
MNVEKIRERLTDGFKPFALHLSDGRKIIVPYPDAIALAPRVVVVITRNERVNIIDPLHIVSIEEKIRKS